MTDKEPGVTNEPAPGTAEEPARETEPEGAPGHVKQFTSAVMVIAVWAGVAATTWAFTRITDGRYMVAFIAAFAFGSGAISTYFVTRRP